MVKVLLLNALRSIYDKLKYMSSLLYLYFTLLKHDILLYFNYICTYTFVMMKLQFNGKLLILNVILNNTLQLKFIQVYYICFSC